MCLTFVSRNYFGEVTFPYKCSKVLSGLLKVTFDVNVPERLTHSPSLQEGTGSQVGRFQGVACAPGVVSAAGGLAGTPWWRTTEVQPL